MATKTTPKPAHQPQTAQALYDARIAKIKLEMKWMQDRLETLEKNPTQATWANAGDLVRVVASLEEANRVFQGE